MGLDWWVALTLYLRRSLCFFNCPGSPCPILALVHLCPLVPVVLSGYQSRCEVARETTVSFVWVD